ncbi:hypothetical protein [Microbaculum marinum]|uniref:PH domain-containing protein n=1 Tax=Microbaculum marinum TaxID=1764581 RepID=A0AAW9RPA6_9HYPH
MTELSRRLSIAWIVVSGAATLLVISYVYGKMLGFVGPDHWMVTTAAPACATPTDYKMAMTAYQTRDWMALLRVSGCKVIGSGSRIEMVDVGTFGPSKVRLVGYSDRPLELYVMHEALVDSPR